MDQLKKMMDEMGSLRKQTSQMGSALGGITKHLEKTNIGGGRLGPGNASMRNADRNRDMFENTDSNQDDE